MLKLIASGLSSKQIAGELGIAFKTVVCHRTNLISKMNALNTADLIHRAGLEGLLEDVLAGKGQPEFRLAMGEHLQAQMGKFCSDWRQNRETLHDELGKYRLLRLERQKLLTDLSSQRTGLEQSVQKLFLLMAYKPARPAPAISLAKSSA